MVHVCNIGFCKDLCYRQSHLSCGLKYFHLGAAAQLLYTILRALQSCGKSALMCSRRFDCINISLHV